MTLLRAGRPAPARSAGCLIVIPPDPALRGHDVSDIFWDRVTVETRGQSARGMPCPAKEYGRRIRRVLQELES